MGNCLRISNKILSHDERSHVKATYKEEEEEAAATKQIAQASTRANKFQMVNHTSDGKKKKTVRFKLDHEEESDDQEQGIIDSQGDNCKSGVVRIKLVVTQEELRQLLNLSKFDTNNSSVEQLLSSLELSRRKVSPLETTFSNNTNGSWRPVLESIPEEH